MRTCGNDYVANRKFGPELTRIVYHADYHTIFGQVVIYRVDGAGPGGPAAASGSADAGSGWPLSF